MVETASALLIVLGAIVLLRIFLQTTGMAHKPPRKRGLRVVESCALGPRKRLHVVEAGGERLLLAASESGVALLKHLPAEPHDEREEEVTSVVSRLWPAARALLQGGAKMVPLALLVAGMLLAADASQAMATGAPAGISIHLDGAKSPEGVSATLEALAFLTLVGVAPSLLLMGTCFTRIVIVLAFLRQAVGVQHLPPNQVLVGLALFTTLFVMAPLGDQIRADAYEPYVARKIDGAEALKRASVPVRRFLMDFTRESDLELFTEMRGGGKEKASKSLDEVPMTTLLPAYMLSELHTAFEIGFMIYLPFLVIDLVIASMLISMGMIVLPPIVISLPFKLMLFVLLDGWHLILGSLMNGLR